MGPRGLDADDDVVDADARSVHDLGVVHQPHAKAGQVVHAVGIEPGHLGRLAAKQRATRLLAAVGDAGHHLGGQIDRELARGEIIQEKKRPGALDQNVVDTHGHKIDTDGIVLSEVVGELELGAHAVGGGHQHGFLAGARFELEKPAKAADVGQDPLDGGPGHKGLDARNQGVAGVDIHAGRLVGCRSVGHGNAPLARCETKEGQPSFFTPKTQGRPDMETRPDRHKCWLLPVCLAAILPLLWNRPLAWAGAKSPSPAAQEDPDDPPRRDIRMGNTENMRLGRDAQGGTVMEMRRPPKDPAAQPPVGPFFIYPQVGTPPGPPPDQGGRHNPPSSPASGSGAQPGASGPAGPAAKPAQPGSAGQSGQVGNTVIYRPGQSGQVGNTVIYGPGQSGQVGNTVIYNPGQAVPPAGPAKGSGS